MLRPGTWLVRLSTRNDAIPWQTLDLSMNTGPKVVLRAMFKTVSKMNTIATSTFYYDTNFVS